MVKRPALFLGLALITAGCGEPTPDPIATVHGTVTFQGRPLAGGIIVFVPDRDRSSDGKTLSAAIDGDGTYRLGNEGSGQIPPGRYRIALAATADPYLSADDSTVAFPLSLRRPDHSGLIREVIAGHENVLDFHVEAVE